LSLAALGWGSDHETWLEIGNAGGPVFWVAGLGSSLVQDGRLGPDHAARTFDGFLVSGVLAEGLGDITNERRPYSNAHDSFPSTHATLSFEIAAAQSYYHPRQTVLWYGVASVIAYSRIPAEEHHWQDVIAGAALGYGAGQLSVSSRHGWIIAPLLEKGRPGLSLTFGRHL
jgi:membrane-associated phospholipid phosphatase